jgi:predicted DNA binding CopG/RHH family protein
MSGKDIELEDLGDYEIDPKTVQKVEQMIAAADAEIDEARVNFRWGKRQVNLVKQAADLMGIPYQIYIKETVYRQALRDIREAQAGMLTAEQWQILALSLVEEMKQKNIP